LALASAQSAPRLEVKTSLMKRIKSRQKTGSASAPDALKRGWISFFLRSAPVWGFALIIVLALGSWLLWSRLNQVNSSNSMRVVALTNTMHPEPSVPWSLVRDDMALYSLITWMVDEALSVYCQK
jgi:hypothetical protein